MKKCLVVLIVGVLILAGTTFVNAAKMGEPMTNARAANLLVHIMGLKESPDADKLPEEARYAMHASMLANEGFPQFEDAKPDDLLNKGMIAWLLYTALEGTSDVSIEEAINYCVDNRYMAAGSKNETVFVRLARTEAREVMTYERCAALLYKLAGFKEPENAEGLSKEELFKIHAEKLQEKYTAKFTGANLNELVTKEVLADVLYNSIFGLTDESGEEKVNHFVQLGLLDEGGVKDPISLGLLPEVEAYGAPEMNPPEPVTPPQENPASLII